MLIVTGAWSWVVGIMFMLGVADGPTPLLVWPAGPMEVHAAFREPIAVPDGLVGKPIVYKTETGFEGTLAIAAARLLAGGRTLVMFTDPHSSPSRFTPPGMPSYDLRGVEAAWSADEEDRPSVKTWLPTIDTQAARKATEGSAEHDRLFQSLTKPGRLTIKAQLVLKPGKRTVRFLANVPIAVELSNSQGQGLSVSFDVDAADFPETLTLVVPTGATAPVLKAAESGQPLPAGSLQMPWAPAPPPLSTAPFEPPYPLEGGDSARGETIFFGETSKCSVCHKIQGKGGDVGPALDRPRQRDRAWLFRAIAAPGDEVRPDYVAYTIATEDGRVSVGTVRAEGAESIRVFDTDGKSTVFQRSEIQMFQPGSTSIMPVGLAGAIGEAGIRDLLAFLMADRPEPSR